MLKIGQNFKSIKSLTNPKKTRSIKFPVAPPSKNPKGMYNDGDL